MQLRRSELERVAAGLGEFDSSLEGDLLTLVEALRMLPVGDRAPAWELATRRFGHHKPLAQAAGEVGLDEVHARDLLGHYTSLLAEVPAPEHEGLVAAPLADPMAQLHESAAGRVVSQEAMGNAIAWGDEVDLDAAHEASLQAVEDMNRRKNPGGAA